MRRLLLFPACLGLTALAAPKPAEVTFNKDVLPVLQKNCQGCHRPGEAAPMPFLDYTQTRPWAKAIKNAVASKKMPPWLADPRHGKFSNDRSLSADDVNTLAAWADSGAKEGNAKDAPKPIAFPGGWIIGKPDVEFEMPNAFDVPASGTVEYHYLILPTNFKEDRWIRAAEVRPGNRAVVHHVLAFVRAPESKWMREKEPGVPFLPARATRGERNANIENAGPSELLVGYAPGVTPAQLHSGQAKLVKAGSDIVLQLHYTTNGKAGTDRSKIGLIFATEPPTERVFTVSATNNKFVIPAGDPAFEVKSEMTLRAPVSLVNLSPHMHVRGKDFIYKAVYPTGETEVLLNVPRYDFNWQLSYYPAAAKVLPAGTRIECTAHFDNSANNAANPDSKKEVRWGDQTWEEMMIGFFDVAIPASMNPIDVIRARKPASTGGE